MSFDDWMDDVTLQGEANRRYRDNFDRAFSGYAPPRRTKATPQLLEFPAISGTSQESVRWPPSWLDYEFWL